MRIGPAHTKSTAAVRSRIHHSRIVDAPPTAAWAELTQLPTR
jgi:hypothetical protein